MIINQDKEQLASELRGSLLRFNQFFYKIITGRDYIVSQPVGRESHHVTICRAYTELFRHAKPAEGLLVNIPPGYGKSVLTSMFVAWSYAHYGDCNFIYISYSHELAAEHTAFIKQVMSCAQYKYLFDTHISSDSRAKDSFTTTRGGKVRAFGSSGAVTGSDAGTQAAGRFSGCVLIDDAHKPNDVHSDTIRQAVIRNYQETILQRPRDELVPIVFIGQRLHEDDLAAYLLSGKDVRRWKPIVLKGIDEAGNALLPETQSVEYLRDLERKHPFVFYSQIQQNPIPSGGSLFKKDWFVILDYEPEILYSFITADTAETSKTHNDATVFSFFGIYEIQSMGVKTGIYGLHWIDCIEIWVEPKDLKQSFIDFWAECMRYKKPPQLAAIEKKSTGSTLLSLLEEIRTIKLMDIPRNANSGNKTARFIDCQPYVAERKVSLPKNGRHTGLCVEHMGKITANDAHRRDDICFVEGTKIATKYGYKNIENINIGDLLITPFGLGKVASCGVTGVYPVVTNIGLTGTSNHPVFYGNNFVRLDTVTDEGIINHLSFYGLFKWRYLRLLFLMESNIGSWGRDAITLVSKKSIQKEKILKDFMWQYGNFIAEKQLKRGLLFITKTIIILTTVTIIWSVFHASNTLKTMKKTGCDGIIAKKVKSIFCWFKSLLKFGTKAKKVEIGIKKMQKEASINQENLTAKYAQKDSLQNHQKRFIAPTIATSSNTQDVLEIKEQEKKQEVYNLTVECYGVYYANNVLVSNCDTLADAIKIALIDKTIISSTINAVDHSDVASRLMSKQNKINRLRDRRG